MTHRDFDLVCADGDGGVSAYEGGWGHVSWVNGDGGHADERVAYSTAVWWAYEEDSTP